MKNFVLTLCILLLLTGCSPQPDFSAEKARLQDVAFNALNAKYNVNMEEWGLDEPDFSVKGIKNDIETFRALTDDDVVYIYGTIPNHTEHLGGEDFPYYAIYSVWRDEIIECEILWSE